MGQGAFIHPTSQDLVRADVIREGTRIWHNVVTLPGSRIASDRNIGKDAFIDANVVVGDRAKIQNGVSLCRGVSVEDGVIVGLTLRRRTTPTARRSRPPDASKDLTTGCWAAQCPGWDRASGPTR